MLNMFFLLHTLPIPSQILISTYQSRNPGFPGENHEPKGAEYNSNTASKARVNLQSTQAQIPGNRQMMVTFCYFWSPTQGRQPILILHM